MHARPSRYSSFRMQWTPGVPDICVPWSRPPFPDEVLHLCRSVLRLKYGLLTLNALAGSQARCPLYEYT
jgi:hypothetical protein